jgi:hypothetical protein
VLSKELEDASKEDETIVNHFHGVSSSSEATEMCVDRQIKVLGSYWKGCMSNVEVNSLYLCTVRDYHVLHKWNAGGTPSQAMELQEMGDTMTIGTSDVPPPSVGVYADMAGESSSGDTQYKFPHLPSSKTVVFKYWTLVSDDLIPHGRNS